MGEEIRKETITAKYIGKHDETKRTVYLFENEKDIEHPLKFSAFEPKLPDLKKNVVYRFTVEHHPRGDGTFFHNLSRRAGRDSVFDIAEADGIMPAPMGPEPAKQEPAKQIDKEARIVCGNAYNAAGAALPGLAALGYKLKPNEQITDVLDMIASHIEKKILEAGKKEG